MVFNTGSEINIGDRYSRMMQGGTKASTLAVDQPREQSSFEKLNDFILNSELEGLDPLEMQVASEEWLRESAGGMTDNTGEIFFGSAGDGKTNFERIRSFMQPKKFENKHKSEFEKFTSMDEAKQLELIYGMDDRDFFEKLSDTANNIFTWMSEDVEFAELQKHSKAITGRVADVKTESNIGGGFTHASEQDLITAYKTDLLLKDYQFRKQQFETYLPPEVTQQVQIAVEVGGFGSVGVSVIPEMYRDNAVAYYNLIRPEQQMGGIEEFTKRMAFGLGKMAKNAGNYAVNFTNDILLASGLFTDSYEEMGTVSQLLEDERKLNWLNDKTDQMLNMKTAERGFFGKASMGVADTVPYMLMLASGGGVVAAAGMAEEFSNVAEYEWGLDRPKAFAVGSVLGVVNVLLEKRQLNGLLSVAGRQQFGVAFAKKLINNFVGEMTVEVLQDWTVEAARQVAQDEKLNMRGFEKSMNETIKESFGTILLMTGGAGVASAASEYRSNKSISEEFTQKAILDELTDRERKLNKDIAQAKVNVAQEEAKAKFNISDSVLSYLEGASKNAKERIDKRLEKVATGGKLYSNPVQLVKYLGTVAFQTPLDFKDGGIIIAHAIAKGIIKSVGEIRSIFSHLPKDQQDLLIDNSQEVLDRITTKPVEIVSERTRSENYPTPFKTTKDKYSSEEIDLIDKYRKGTSKIKLSDDDKALLRYHGFRMPAWATDSKTGIGADVMLMELGEEGRSLFGLNETSSIAEIAQSPLYKGSLKRMAEGKIQKDVKAREMEVGDSFQGDKDLSGHWADEVVIRKDADGTIYTLHGDGVDSRIFKHDPNSVLSTNFEMGSVAGEDLKAKTEQFNEAIKDVDFNEPLKPGQKFYKSKSNARVAKFYENKLADERTMRKLDRVKAEQKLAKNEANNAAKREKDASKAVVREKRLNDKVNGLKDQIKSMIKDRQSTAEDVNFAKRLIQEQIPAEKQGKLLTMLEKVANGKSELTRRKYLSLLADKIRITQAKIAETDAKNRLSDAMKRVSKAIKERLVSANVVELLKSVKQFTEELTPVRLTQKINALKDEIAKLQGIDTSSLDRVADIEKQIESLQARIVKVQDLGDVEKNFGVGKATPTNGEEYFENVERLHTQLAGLNAASSLDLMSTGEMNSIADEIESILETGKSKYLADLEAKKDVHKEIVNDILSYQEGKFKPSLRDRKALGKWFDSIRIADTTPVLLFKKAGAQFTKLFDNLFDAEKKRLRVLKQFTEAAVERWSAMNEKYGDRYSELLDIEILFHGHLEKITINEAMAIYAYSKNKIARKHLDNTWGFTGENVAEQNDAQVDKITEAIPKEIRDVIDNELQYSDSVIYTMMNEVFAEMTGTYMKKEDSYFMINHLHNIAVSDDTNIMADIAHHSAAVADGITKDRAANVQSGFGNFDYFGTYGMMLDRASNYIGLQQAMTDTVGVLNNKAVKAYLGTISPKIYDAMIFSLQNVARGGLKNAQDAWSKSVRKLRGMTSLALLTGGVTTVFKTAMGSMVGSYISSVRLNQSTGNNVDSKRYKTSTGKIFFTVAKDMVKSIHTIASDKLMNDDMAQMFEESIYMKDRDGGINRELVERKKEISKKSLNADIATNVSTRLSQWKYTPNSQVFKSFIDLMGQIGKKRDVAVEFFLDFISRADRMTVTAIYTTTRNAAIEKGMSEVEAIKMAEAVVHDSQSGGDMLSLPYSFTTESETQRAFSQFRNDINKQLNVVVDAYNTGGKVEAMKAGLWSVVLPSVTAWIISNGRPPTDEEDLFDIGKGVLQDAIGGSISIPSILASVALEPKWGSFVPPSLSYPSKLLQRAADTGDAEDIGLMMAFVAGLPTALAKRVMKVIEHNDARYLIWSSESDINKQNELLGID